MSVLASSEKRVRLVRPVNYVLLGRPDGWNGKYYTVNSCETCGKKGEFLGKSKSYGCFECTLCVECYEAEEDENKCQSCFDKCDIDECIVVVDKLKGVEMFVCPTCHLEKDDWEDDEDDDRAKCEDCNTDIEDDPESVTIGNRYKFHQTHQVCIECADKQCHWCGGEEGVFDTLENGTQVCEECRPSAEEWFNEEEEDREC